jgi:rubrerythrin
MKSRAVQDRTKNQAELFVNRTGIMTNPDLSAQLIRSAKETIPSSSGDGKEAASHRAQHSTDEFRIGSSPVAPAGPDDANEPELPPGAEGLSMLLDKLGERLAFEREGTRLYEAFLQKVETTESTSDMGPSPGDLRHICAEELEHFKLLQQAISGMRGDATIQSPSADVAGVLSHGVLQIVTDPRTTVPQALQAMLTAELADNDGWQMLKMLAEKLKCSDLANQCEKAFQEEQEHLTKVRGWLASIILGSVAPNEALPGNGGPEVKPRSNKGSKRSTRSRTSKRAKKRKR